MSTVPASELLPAPSKLVTNSAIPATINLVELVELVGAGLFAFMAAAATGSHDDAVTTYMRRIYAAVSCNMQ